MRVSVVGVMNGVMRASIRPVVGGYMQRSTTDHNGCSVSFACMSGELGREGAWRDKNFNQQTHEK